MSKFTEWVIYALAIVAVIAAIAMGEMAMAEETWRGPPAMLQVKYPGDIAWRNDLRAPIPLADCVAMATRVARYWDQKWRYTPPNKPPQVRCEVIHGIS